MDFSTQRTISWQFLRFKLLLLLRHILHIWVRSKVFPEPLSSSQINPDSPVFYVMDTDALSSVLILDKACEYNGLPRPLSPIEGNGKAAGQAWAALRKLSGFFVRRYSTRRSPRAIENLVDAANSNPDFEVQLVPVSILIGRAPEKESSVFKLFFSEGWAVEGRLRRLLSTLINGRDTCVYYGPPASLRELVDETSDAAIAVRKICRLTRTQLRQIRETAIGPDLSHSRTIVKQIMSSNRVKIALSEASSSSGKSIEAFQLEAQVAIREISANYSYTAIRFSDVVLSWFWNRIFQGVELNHFQEFENNSIGKEIIYVPCHRSHIDYLLLSYLLYTNGHVPPHIAAGANLNLPFLGKFLRRCGAFFLRRSFREEPVYAAVFDEYLSTILAQNVSIEYFIEGGRSRTGRLLPPKGGMLQMTIRAYLGTPKKPIIFQPVYIGYEQLVEGSSYISELSGKEKKSESLSDLFSVFGILRRNYGKVHVNFGEPIHLDNLLEHAAPNWKTEDVGERPPWLPSVVDTLATSIMTNINGAADVNPVNLLAICLLATAKHALPRQDLASQIELCLCLLKSSPSDSMVTITDLEPNEIINYGEKIGVIETRKHTLGDIIFVPEKAAVQLTYFRNNVAHLFAVPSFLASCFLIRNEILRSRVLRQFSLIYPYLQRELFLPGSSSEAKRTLAHYIAVFGSLGLITGKRTLKRASGGSQGAASLGLLGRGLLQTFERYFITVSVLVHKGSGVLSSDELETLCILYAQRISLLHGFDAPEFYDKTLFRQFIKNLSLEGILSENEQGKLEFDEVLQSISEDAKLVMSTELRHGIIQVASGSV